MDNKTDCTNRAAVVADELLSIGAVFLSPDKPFTWASGIKSPIYCDNRLTLTAPDVRNNIENSLAEIIRTDYPEARGSHGYFHGRNCSCGYHGAYSRDCPWATFAVRALRITAGANQN